MNGPNRMTPDETLTTSHQRIERANTMNRTTTILLAATLSLATLPAIAGEDNLCGTFAYIAESTMMARQNGMSLADLLKLREDSYNDTPAIKKMIFDQTIIAYKQPRYQTKANQQRAIDDFRDMNHVQCLDALSQ